jgi:hypothetical protein
MQRRRSRCSRRQRVLVLAVAPLVAVAATGSLEALAAIQIQNIKPAVGATSAAPAPGTLTAAGDGPITAYPFVPRVNGFQPFVVFGLTNENENDFFSPKSLTPVGATPVPNPAQYFVATLDTGGQATIIGYEDTQAINLFANGLEGVYDIEVVGSSGSEFLDVSDALGLYITGLANATPGTGGPVVPPSSLKGMWNTSILTTPTPDSVIPNLIGNPIAAHWQLVMRNSQTQRLTVNGQTYQGPQVELRNIDTAHDSSFVRAPLTATSAGGANSDPIFFPDFFGSEDWSDNPISPTIWNALMCNATVADAGGGGVTRSFLLDTGAQVSVISSETATSIGINTGGSNPTPHDFTVEVLGVGGITVVKGYYLDQFTIQSDGVDLEATNVPVLVLDVDDPSDGEGSVPGIIGMNLFNDRDLIINAKVGSGSYLAFSEFAFEARWNANSGGDWGDNSKWMLGVPWEPGAPANFTAATTAPQTINVEADYTLGTMKLENANRYTISGPGTLRFEGVITDASIQVNTGSHTIAAPVELASNTNVAVLPAASVLTMSGEISSPNASDMTKTGQGTVEVKRFVDVGDVDIQAGKMKVLVGSGGAAGTSSIDTLTIDPTARLDLTNNNLVIRDGYVGTATSVVYDGIQAYAQRAYNFGAWDEPGLATSMPDAGPLVGLTTIGIASAEQILFIGATDTGVFAGQTVTGSSVIAMYTYAGDMNFDGLVDAADYGVIDNFVQFPGSDGYANGDLNYDGVIDAADYGIIDNTIQLQGDPFPGWDASAFAGLAAVPEPSAGGFAILAAATALGARRRRR